MVYDFGKQKSEGPNTFAVEVKRVEATEPRQFRLAVQEPEPQEPRKIAVQVQTTQPHSFYTIPQLAELLQVHENTIYRLVRAGKIEHYKVGAQIRISAAELERLKVERKS